MRLQRLEIAGFKSFSERAELSFDQGVTAIVGPNGCGKSNVADAIVWVLGEQSAKSLRGDRMEDVIFSGSEARKPTATAEVRLLLAGVRAAAARARGTNGEADAVDTEQAAMTQLELGGGLAREIEVTRRLYRSGESEYLINGETCRLRDVHDLLADTGLGAKAYAIIEQGKIGQILSSRAVDRRQLIEEAAGITKYKARRRAAELKLEAARQNLTRIEDIVFEIEKQRGALKRQAAKARRYRRLRDELRAWEKTLLVERGRVLFAALETTRAKLAEAHALEAAASARLAGIETELAGVRLGLTEAEAEAVSVREALYGHEKEIDRRRSQLEFNRQQMVTLDERAAAVAAELQVLGERQAPARAALGECRAAAAVANGERDRAAEAMAAGQEAYHAAHQRVDALEASVESARRDVYAALNAATALKHAVESAGVARDRVVAQLARLEAEASDLSIEAAKAGEARDAAAAALAASQQALRAATAEREAREMALAASRAAHEQRARELRAREQDLAGVVARLGSLEELDQARAAFGDAARLVLSGEGAVAHLGSVADHVEVEGPYERAVEAALGDLLQCVLVRRHDDAAAGLAFVRERGAGRCGFLVVEDAADLAAADDPVLGNETGLDDGPAAGESPVAGHRALMPLDSMLRVTGPHAGAIRSAVGRFLVADSFERAAEVARSTGATVVTLAGEVCRGRNLVAGGERAETRGILATKREIKELRVRVDEERATVSGVGRALEELEADLLAGAGALAALNGACHGQEKTILGHELRVAQLMEEIDRLRRKTDLLATERRQAEEERRALEERQVEARASIAQRELDQRDADERLALAQRSLLGARDAAEQAGQRAAEARATHAALRERAAAMASDVTRLEEAAAELEARLAAHAGELDQVRRRRREADEASAALERHLVEDADELERRHQRVREAEDRLAALRERGEGVEGRIRAARQDLDEVRAGVSDLEVARAGNESDVAHLRDQCAETLQITLEDLLAEFERDGREGRAPLPGPAAEEPEEEEGDEGGEAVPAEGAAEDAPPATAAPEAHIAVLRKKIDRLGPVNMMAIEQFDELEERHRFLTVQRQDLVDSIAATGEAIKRIDQTSKQRFREAFDAINAFFQETFTILFGGGRAGLSLLDESDLLESGIEINAQPPGKRLQNVQLLSGGEKAMTAIALMFAIFKYKPSPFCLLDEIDAPLDDANIGRFIDILRSMQENTQFILITHNRKTMEIADRLYGVTMEEPGVSRLISVRLH